MAFFILLKCGFFSTELRIFTKAFTYNASLHT